MEAVLDANVFFRMLISGGNILDKLGFGVSTKELSEYLFNNS
ncbi:MAG: hypothetical protein V1859_06685 [archaeon]